MYCFTSSGFVAAMESSGRHISGFLRQGILPPGLILFKWSSAPPGRAGVRAPVGRRRRPSVFGTGAAVKDKTSSDKNKEKMLYLRGHQKEKGRSDESRDKNH